ncbi:MAG: DNA polymerase III subunit gamma/tau [Acidimicrobiales bacterium]
MPRSVAFVADEAYQSLYRRFRPQRFDEVRGQDHVIRALRNAVRDAKVSHAYLFSGPRGTGKTSTARILAKALNCTAVLEGEPCGACPSCAAIQTGSSLDVHELDAASHNGVDAMRDLVSRSALGTPGRWKIYIVDEVHMLSTSASNTLLKTLEEPPAHVVFVLATTDPQKVLPTIRSRTQHYEFRLLGGEVLSGLLADINRAAGLGVPPDAIDFVVRRGKGSARDALSVLDQVAAAGEVEDEISVTDEVMEALCERDAGRALMAVAEGCRAGRDPRRLAVDLLDHLRQGFLTLMAPALVELADTPGQQVEDQARRLGPAALVRAMEQIGTAQIEMRESLDPRVNLETALVRLARPDADASPSALLERIEALERRVEARGGAAPTEPRPPPPIARPTAAVPPTAAPTPPGPAAGRPADDARATLGALRKRPSAPPAPAVAPGPAARRTVAPPPSPPAAPSVGGGAVPSRDELTKAWGDTVYRTLSAKARARFSGGRFSGIKDGIAVFVAPNDVHAARCREVKLEVEAALATHFGVAVLLSLVAEASPPSSGESRLGPDPGAALVLGAPDGVVDAEDRHDDPFTAAEDLGPGGPATAPVASPAERLKQAFPGAEEVAP